MKKFEVYKNIRKRALIFGLPISLFALQMITILASLMVIIFSFGLSIIAVVSVLNIGLYILLLRLAQGTRLTLQLNPFPKTISNKKSTVLYYED
ncbi:hypothetical protein B4Q04_21835 [Zobellia sp. OII3]|nr:hypothetical protein B4Q04_21835 [Zobellia sp. OII3]